MGSLTKGQRLLILGCLLGDGHMRKKTNALLEIIHGARQRAYVDWKYERLKDLTLSPPKLKVTKTRIAYRFTTRSLPELTRIHDEFYRDGVKTIPEHLGIHPLTLAVWLMDDGSRSRNDVYINTQGFSLKDQKKLVRILRDQLGIKVTINRDKQYRRLRIAKESNPRVAELVAPYVLPQFRRKIPSL